MAIKKTAKELRKAIKDYFLMCDGTLALDEESGMPIPAKGGGYVYDVLPKAPTITGLAIAIGLNSRKELFEKANDTSSTKTAQILELAIARIEEYAERELINSGSSGIKFFLSSNFEGWNGEDDKKQKGQSDTILSTAATQTLQKLLSSPEL